MLTALCLARCGCFEHTRNLAIGMYIAACSSCSARLSHHSQRARLEDSNITNGLQVYVCLLSAVQVDSSVAPPVAKAAAALVTEDLGAPLAQLLQVTCDLEPLS